MTNKRKSHKCKFKREEKIRIKHTMIENLETVLPINLSETSSLERRTCIHSSTTIPVTGDYMMETHLPYDCEEQNSHKSAIEKEFLDSRNGSAEGNSNDENALRNTSEVKNTISGTPTLDSVSRSTDKTIDTIEPKSEPTDIYSNPQDDVINLWLLVIPLFLFLVILLLSLLWYLKSSRKSKIVPATHNLSQLDLKENGAYNQFAELPKLCDGNSIENTQSTQPDLIPLQNIESYEYKGIKTGDSLSPALNQEAGFNQMSGNDDVEKFLREYSSLLTLPSHSKRSAVYKDNKVESNVIDSPAGEMFRNSIISEPDNLDSPISKDFKGIGFPLGGHSEISDLEIVPIDELERMQSALRRVEVLQADFPIKSYPVNLNCESDEANSSSCSQPTAFLLVNEDNTSLKVTNSEDSSNSRKALENLVRTKNNTISEVDTNINENLNSKSGGVVLGFENAKKNSFADKFTDPAINTLLRSIQIERSCSNPTKRASIIYRDEDQVLQNHSNDHEVHSEKIDCIDFNKENQEVTQFENGTLIGNNIKTTDLKIMQDSVAHVLNKRKATKDQEAVFSIVTDSNEEQKNEISGQVDCAPSCTKQIDAPGEKLPMSSDAAEYSNSTPPDMLNIGPCRGKQKYQNIQDDVERSADAEESLKTTPSLDNIFKLDSVDGNEKEITNVDETLNIRSKKNNPPEPGNIDCSFINIKLRHYDIEELENIEEDASPAPTSHVVVVGYFARRHDEMNLFVGDLIGIEKEYEDGWARGQNISQGRKRFYFPIAVTRPILSGPSQKVKKNLTLRTGNQEHFVSKKRVAIPEREHSRRSLSLRVKKSAGTLQNKKSNE